MLRIESSDNKKIKRLISLKQKKVRFKENLFLAEGIKIVNEAVLEKSVIDMILISDSFNEKNEDFCDQLTKEKIIVYITSDRNFQKCSSLKTPQGIIAVLNKPNDLFDDIISKDKPLIVLDGISDPGNLGTIIRTADVFGFGGVLATHDSADIYSMKTVQATMGSILRLKCAKIKVEDMDKLRNNGYTIYGMDLNGSAMAVEHFSKAKIAIVIGSESHGISDSIKAKCDKLIKISMRGGAESLNAAVAAGIVLNKVSESNPQY